MAGSVTQRGKDRWFLRVDACRDPLTGRRRQVTRTVSARNVTEARKALAQLATEVEAGRHDRGTDARTVADACLEWLAMAGPSMAGNTTAAFGEALQRYVAPRIGKVPLAKLRAHDLDRLYSTLLASGGRGGRPLAPATVRKVHVALSLALAQAVRWEWLPANPARNASPPSAPPAEIAPPDPDTCRKLLGLAEQSDPEWATFLRLSAATGRRRGELCALAWDAVDLKGATITIRRAIEVVPGGIHVRESPKSAAGVRQIALDSVTVAALAAHRGRAEEAALACGVSLGRKAFVFSRDPAGEHPWHPERVTRKFIRLRRAAGIGDTVRLHDLRHYVGSQLVAAGYDPVSIAGRLGHDPKVLLSTYAHWMPARDKDQAEYLGRLLDGPELRVGASGQNPERIRLPDDTP